VHSETGIPAVGALYVVATPIGNLQDITLRAVETLKAVDAIAAEDTRVTRQLLGHLGISTRPFALHEHNEDAAATRVIEMLHAGKSIALVSDAGTPAVSDPGAVLVRRVRSAGYAVVPVPGPSAAIAALSVAGMRGPFLFHGFLPAQPDARRRALEDLRSFTCTLVFFEAPHRVRETVAALAATLGDERDIVIARELTKVFESIHACTLGEAGDWLDGDRNRLRGEFVLVVAGSHSRKEAPVADGERVLRILLATLPVKQAVALAVEITGGKRNALYALALELQTGAPTTTRRTRSR